MREGDRVVTPLGAGVITKITRDFRWIYGEAIEDLLFVVKLDDRPATGMRPVFYSKDVHPVDPEEYSTRAENQAEARAVEDDQFRRHIDDAELERRKTR